jgi:hypothetical protein
MSFRCANPTLKHASCGITEQGYRKTENYEPLLSDNAALCAIASKSGSLQRRRLDRHDEYALLPLTCYSKYSMQVRHNEDKLNMDLSARVRWEVQASLCDLPATKANLLFQAHFGRTPLPLADYRTDTKLTLDNAIRLLQAMIDTVASQGWFDTTLTCINLLQVRLLLCSRPHLE